MKYTVLLLTGALFFCNGYGQAKRLNTQQALGTAPSLTKATNTVRGWADADHYIEWDVMEKKEYAVHVRTGKRTPYTAPAEKNNRVFVQEGDIFIVDEAAVSRQLTKTTPEEKNPVLSPDNQYVAFTRDNDLYSIRVSDGKEFRHTSDATELVYNGWASWVYYEEILGRPSRYRAFWWSPDSKTIAFMRFDDNKVPLFSIYSSDGQRGFWERTRYPKAGEENPEVKIGFVPVESNRVTWADFNEKEDQYFGQPYWSYDSKQLMVQWINRDQDHLKFYLVNPVTGAKTAIYDEKQKEWIDLDHSERITYLADNKHYILKSDKTGWAHYYLYTLDGQLVNAITAGNWQVSGIKRIDEKNKTLYFAARKESSTTIDLYSIQLSGKNIRRLSFGDYTHDVDVSPDGRHFITTYSSVSIPPQTALVNNSGKIIRQIADSRSDDFDSYVYGKTTLITIPTPDGYQLPATITWPTDFDENKPYPVVMSVYGGPDAGNVKNTWKGVNNQYWANEGIIQISVDHRGSGHFGKAGVALMHRQLGHWEIIDYSTAAKWLKEKPWVAKNKLLITGHSYGGYVTCLALTKAPAYFDFGIAGAPVTSWELYDTHYTEKFMDRPQDNPEGYKNGSVLTYTDNYKGVLRVMHGDMDDNVHMQNTIQLADRLTSRSVPFELMIYPGSRHGWGRDKTAYDRRERARFYYQYLLEKPLPEELF